MFKGSALVTAGIIVIFIGFILLFVGSALQASDKSSEVKTGGVVLIGPIPIIFGSDKGLVVTAVIMAIVLMILAYFLFYRGYRIF